RPDRLWFSDLTQHRVKDGWVYCAAVIDAYSRRVVGWSISDRITSEIVVDALEMARWQRRPQPGTIVHADRGAQYTSWVFGHRLRQAGLLGSMGRVASSVDNALIESFWSTMQRELLDRHDWQTRTELASAMFEWIEAFYNPRRRHSDAHERQLPPNQRWQKQADPATVPRADPAPCRAAPGSRAARSARPSRPGARARCAASETPESRPAPGRSPAWHARPPGPPRPPPTPRAAPPAPPRAAPTPQAGPYETRASAAPDSRACAPRRRSGWSRGRGSR